MSTPKDILRNIITLRHFCHPVSHRLFLIFGCQRSGTTLLLSILSAHPQIIGVDETEFPSPYPFPGGLRLIYNQIFNYYSCFKMLEHSDKLEFLKTYYPQAKIIWTVRNPYSTILSMQNLVNSDGNWIERCGLREISRLLPFYSELKSLNLAELSDIEIGAIYWTFKNKFVQFFLDSGFAVCAFKYEDLLSNPRNQLEQLMHFLGLDWHDNLLNYAELNPGKMLAGGTRTDSPLDISRIKDIDKLTVQEISKINSIAQDVMLKYNYKIEAV